MLLADSKVEILEKYRQWKDVMKAEGEYREN